MGGNSVSSGAENQAAAAAYVAVRMLLERRLNWAAPSDDVPIAVAGEVGGAGDDLQIAFGSRRAPIDVQCKRSLSGHAAVKAAIRDMVRGLEAEPSDREIVLLLGSGSSTEVRDTFATDVRNFRQGRSDALRSITRAVLSGVEGAAHVLSRLYVVSLDVGAESDAGSQNAIEALRQALVEPSRAEEAWAILVRHALKLGQRGKWVRSDVESLLRGSGLTIRPIGPDAAWLEQIEFARKLNANWRQRTAAGVLDHLATEIDAKDAAPDTRRQLHGVRGAAALALGERDRALREFGRALDYTSPQLEKNASPEARKKWCDARFNYGLVLFMEGDDAGAQKLAREILAADSHNVHGWALLARTNGDGELATPADLREAPEYREALANVAAKRADWNGVIEHLAPAIASGYRGPQTLNGYAQGLLNFSLQLQPGPDRQRLLERAERAADEAIRTIENGELDGLLAMLLFIRARSKEELKRVAEAEADFDRAAALDPTEPNILMRVVRMRVENGDNDGALALLTDAAANASPMIRLLRAELRAEEGDRAGAEHDLAQTLDELPGSAISPFVSLYLKAAEIGLDLVRSDLVERALHALSEGGFGEDGPDAGVLRARLAIAKENLDAAEREYRAAATRASSEDSSRILVELATRLGLAGQFDRAITTFEEAGATVPSHSAFRNFVVALMRASRFDRVVTLAADLERNAIESGGRTADLPPTLLEAAIDVAWRTEDYARVARLLDARLDQEEREHGLVPTHLVLAAAVAHADGGNNSRSADLVNEALSRADLEPEDRMRAANVLVKLGASQRAIEVAFKAVRLRPTDKRMVGNFMHVVLMPSLRPAAARPDDWRASAKEKVDEHGPEPELSAPETKDEYGDEDTGSDGTSGMVGPDSFVRVVADDGQCYDYFIYREPPVDARLQEYLLSDTAVSDLVGKSVGETIVRNVGTWHEQRLRIVRVLPAVVVVFRRYMRTFAVQFPGETPFRTFKVGENPTLQSLGPILAAMHTVQESHKNTLAMYNESPVPLGVVARVLGRKVPDVIAMLAADASQRIWVDGPPYSDYASSLKTALEKPSIVLTRPALFFLDRLGLWQLVSERYRLVAPKSMMEEWQEELRELAQLTDSGRIFFHEGAGKPVVDSIPAGAAESTLTASRSLHDRVAAAASVMPRPASALNPEDDKWRELLGATSFDAVALARANGAALYADDLGLRVIASAKYDVASFATVALLDALRAEGRLPDATFENAVVRLIEWGHDMVQVRPATIAAAFGGAGQSAHAARRVLDHIADSRVTAASAAIVAAGGLKMLMTTSIATATLEDAATQVTEALTRQREPEEVMPFFRSALSDLFRLLPNDLRRVEVAAAKVLRNRIVRFADFEGDHA